MGKIENKVKKQIRVGKIEKALLNSLLVCGLVSMAVFAPNALKIFGKTWPIGQRKSYLRKSISRLKDKGLIMFEDRGGQKVLALTKKGKLYLNQATEGSLLEPKKWDGKWRMVTFDIPETKKAVRNRVREMVLALGFKRLQNSVWVSPYDNEDFIILLKAELQIGKELLYVVADEIEYDKPLKKEFGLE